MCQIKTGICRLRVNLKLERDNFCASLGDSTHDFGPFFLSNLDRHYGRKQYWVGFSKTKAVIGLFEILVFIRGGGVLCTKGTVSLKSFE